MTPIDGTLIENLITTVEKCERIMLCISCGAKIELLPEFPECEVICSACAGSQDYADWQRNAL